MNISNSEVSDNLAQPKISISGAGKTDFVRQASHDIQGLFFGVCSISQMVKLAIENQEDGVLLLLDHLINACHTYKHKLSNFVEYTRLDADIKDTISESINVHYLFTRVVNELESMALEKETIIHLSVCDDMPEEIISDELRIAQIATNILANAIIFSPSKSQVFIEIKKQSEENWVMTVEDNGEGMNADQVNSIFKILPKERKSLKNPGGLGLLISRYLTENILRGKIRLSSKPLIGTVCQVILPFNISMRSEDNFMA